jgi:hypothetical protein
MITEWNERAGLYFFIICMVFNLVLKYRFLKQFETEFLTRKILMGYDSFFIYKMQIFMQS